MHIYALHDCLKFVHKMFFLTPMHAWTISVRSEPRDERYIYIHAYNMHGNDLQVVACGLVGWVGMFAI